MYIEKIDTIERDISQFGKKIGYRNVNGKVKITYALDFPPYTNSKTFSTDKEANDFISQIKKEGDTIKYS